MRCVMNNDLERAKILSDLLLKSRKSMNISQDYMAMGLGVSKIQFIIGKRAPHVQMFSSYAIGLSY